MKRLRNFAPRIARGRRPGRPVRRPHFRSRGIWRLWVVEPSNGGVPPGFRLARSPPGQSMGDRSPASSPPALRRRIRGQGSLQSPISVGCPPPGPNLKSRSPQFRDPAAGLLREFPGRPGHSRRSSLRRVDLHAEPSIRQAPECAPEWMIRSPAVDRLGIIRGNRANFPRQSVRWVIHSKRG